MRAVVGSGGYIWLSRAFLWVTLLFPGFAGGATFTVTNGLDVGSGSLRQAILQANTNPGPDLIAFQLPAGSLVIHPLIELPAITDPVRIDGTTQPGYSGRPLVEINGDLITFAYGLRLESSNSIVNGLAITHFAATGAAGLMIFGPDAWGNWVFGNHIGVDGTGSNAAPNFDGIVLDVGAHHNLIGTDGDGTNDFSERNIISGQTEAGIVLFDTQSNRVAGNFIGTDRDGSLAFGNEACGVLVSGATSQLIGGTNVVLGNRIAYNAAGIQIVGTNSSQITILGNSIFRNSSLGIELGSDGVTPNDAGDADSGPNGLQNFPVLISATPFSGSTVVHGTLNSVTGGVFRVELFVNDSPDPSGNGEGQTSIGSVAVTTDAAGNGSFSVVLGLSLPVGKIVTATATDSSGNSSEFSHGIPVAALLALANQTVLAGETVLFQTTDLGDAATYQWTLDGVALSNETTYVLIRSNVTLAAAGEYCVAVNGAFGSATNCAVLTVNAAPTITCPAPILADAPLGACAVVVSFTVSATGSPTPTVACIPPSGSAFVVGTTLVSCTASNIAGTTNCSFAVTVRDVTPPALACAPDRTVECGVAWAFSFPSATDLCDGTNITVLVVGTTTNALCGGTFTATRLWRAVDGHSNSVECSQTVMVLDTLAPLLVGVPAGTNVQCLLDVPAPAIVTATDNCDANPVVTLSVSTNGTCPLFINRTWVASDACNNASTNNQVITVLDTIAPVLVGVPPATNVQCLADVPTPALVTAIDNCDTNAVVTLSVSTNGLCPVVITRTWVARDACNNTSTNSQVITVLDTIPPALVGVPPATNVQCLADVPAPAAVTATDNCEFPPIVTFSSITNGTCPAIIHRTWLARDFCNNRITNTQVITVLDTIPPVLVGVPASTNVQCLANVPAPPLVTAVDNCDPTPVVGFSSITNGTCPATIIRTWLGQDFCNNSITNTQVITVLDTVPPVLVGVPASTNVQCLADVPAPDNVTAIDNCDANPVVTLSVSTNGTCPRFITRTWVAHDTCSNTSTNSQVITVLDTIAPVLVGVPPATNVQCLADVPAPAPVTAIDNCDPTPAVTFFAVTNGTCPATIFRTWVARDFCNNSLTNTQIIVVHDTLPPVLAGVPSDANFQCLADVPAPPGVTATDNCDPNPVVALTQTTNGFAPLIMTRTWTATDFCSNVATQVQIITVNDTIPPVIVCASNRVVECGTAWNFTAPSAVDNCDGTNLNLIVSATVTNPLCGRTFIAIRTWQATDSHTNRSECSQAITIIDSTSPTILCASNRIVECGTPWTFDPPIASDICDGTNLTIVLTTTTNALVGQTYAATRTWRAIDSCTNSSVCSQTVTIVDTTPPAIVCSTNIIVECAGPPGTVVAFASSAGDICDTNVLLVCVPPSGSTFALGLTTVRCLATDDSGNTNGCTFTVRVRDTTPPTIACPANIIAAELPHDGGSAVVTFGLPLATDICDNSLAISCVPPSGSVFPIGYSTVVCQARDDSGNSNLCSFVIRVIPYRLSVTLVTTTNDSGPGSLRQALLDANDAPGENLVVFNLLGGGAQVIHLLSPLPVVTSPVIIDGWSQPGFSGAPLVELDGSSAGGGANGLVVNAGNSTIRGMALNGFATAIRLQSNGNNVVHGNWIGLRASGTNAPGNTGDGIYISSASNVIGGIGLNERNVIAASGGSGIRLDTSGAVSNSVVGNFIGTGPDGIVPAGNILDGVRISTGGARNTLGGVSVAGLGNWIAFNGRNGVGLDADAGTGNGIRGNVIFSNVALGIDLGVDGVTMNDSGDSDPGPNRLQNFPVLSDARSEAGITTIDGILNSVPSATYRLDFFLNDVTDPTGYGEGARYVGSADVQVGPSGSESFSTSFVLTATYLQFITATATDPANNTSEFSQRVQVRTPPVLELQPAATTVQPGETATLCAQASGTPPIFYQWRLNGANIPGATNPCYVIPAAQVADGGTYNVIVNNVLGALQTGQAPLTLPVGVLAGGDYFSARVVLEGLSNTVAGANRAATQEPGEPLHAGKPGGKSVWYTWEAPVTGVASIGTKGSTFDTLLGVYEGDIVSNLTAVASDEDRGGFYTSRVRFNAIKGHQYHFAIDGYGGQEGEFLFEMTHGKESHLLPVFDLQPVSQTIAPGGSVTFTSIAQRVCGAGHRGCPDPLHFPEGELPQLDYQWFLNGIPIPGATHPSLTKTNVQASDVGDYTIQISTRWQLIESDPASLQINETGLITEQVQAMDKFLDAALAPVQLRLGNGAAQLVPAGGGGGFEPAAVIRGYTGTQTFNSTNARSDITESSICGVAGGASEWITMVMEESGTLFINTDGSSYDTVIAVFQRNPTNFLQLQLLACDNNSGLDGRDSALSFQVQAGKTNYLMVDGVNGFGGVLRLNVSLVTRASISPLSFTNNAPKVRVNTHANARFSIQASTDLRTWTTVLTTNSPASIFDFIDTSSIDNPRRFYRTQMLP